MRPIHRKIQRLVGLIGAYFLKNESRALLTANRDCNWTTINEFLFETMNKIDWVFRYVMYVDYKHWLIQIWQQDDSDWFNWSLLLCGLIPLDYFYRLKANIARVIRDLQPVKLEKVAQNRKSKKRIVKSSTYFWYHCKC